MLEERSQVGRSPAINGLEIKHQKLKIDFKMRWKPMATAQGDGFMS